MLNSTKSYQNTRVNFYAKYQNFTRNSNSEISAFLSKIMHELSLLKGTVSVISSNLLRKYGNSRFTMVRLEDLYDQG